MRKGIENSKPAWSGLVLVVHFLQGLRLHTLTAHYHGNRRTIIQTRTTKPHTSCHHSLFDPFFHLWLLSHSFQVHPQTKCATLYCVAIFFPLRPMQKRVAFLQLK